MRSAWMTEEHAMFAESVGRFMQAELVPNIDRWREQHRVDREFWLKAGEAGLLGPAMPSEFGGTDCDQSFDAIVGIEQTLAGDTNWGWSAHNIALHYVNSYGTPAQRERWLPKLISGEMVAAIAMTEPHAGSDLQAIRTKALRDGDSYVLNGSKVYITNGQTADLIIVVCKTDPDNRAAGVSLLALEVDGAEGFRRGRNLKKLGLDGADTSELFFEDVRVPADHLIGGEEGQGFKQLMLQLPWERTMLALLSVANMKVVLGQTLTFVKEREVFGKRLFDMQNTRFKLAECKTKLDVTEAFVDKCMVDLIAGQLTAVVAAEAKWWSSEQLDQVVDECLQLHGGAGLMLEYPVSHYYRDARFGRIVGGTTEIMKEIIARSMEGEGP